MRPGSAVQMMGIRIGQIEEVIPYIDKDTSYVKVKFVITQTGITIPTASTISIQQSGIIGEKFLEITPPQPQIAYLPITTTFKSCLKENSPVELLVDGKFITIGKVRNTEIVDKRTLPDAQKIKIFTPWVYKVEYINTTPGILIPEDSIPVVKGAHKDYKLRLTPPDNTIVQVYESDSKYTIVEPMRLKELFDLQLETAISLKETNDKINTLLSDDSIKNLKQTLKNTKDLTAQATITLRTASSLMGTTESELKSVIVMASNLSGRMIKLSDNLNDVIGDPEVKKNFLATAASMQKSTKEIAEILSDPKLKETVNLVNSSTKDLSEITSYVNSVSKDPEFRTKLDGTVTNLSISLEKLSKALDSVNDLTKSDEHEIKAILQDSAEASKNLKKFSERLNKRFLLFRLMF
jgi:ABC-type transporter Mla subunit MlaD